MSIRSTRTSKVYIYIANYQKISNVLSTPRQYFAKKVRLQLTSKHVESQCCAGSRRLSGREFQVDGPATATAVERRPEAALREAHDSHRTT